MEANQAKQEISLAVFDMAGTTVDEDNVVYKTLREAINRQDHDFPLDQVLLYGAGKEKLQAIKDLLATVVSDPNQLDRQADAAFRYFRQRLETAYEDLEIDTFPGTPDLLRHLRQHGVKVVLNTGYDRTTAQGLVDKLGWTRGEEFDLLVTADDVARGRPAPDMILLAMEQLGVTEPEKVAKVGDSIVDIEEGKAARCGLTLGVTTGAQTASQLRSAEPDDVIDSLLEIKDKITFPEVAL